MRRCGPKREISPVRVLSTWTMPDSMGKRQRRDVKARKAAAIEERRLARARRREDRANGLIEPGSPIVEPEPDILVEARSDDTA
jgi:hypothetical protein